MCDSLLSRFQLAKISTGCLKIKEKIGDFLTENQKLRVESRLALTAFGNRKAKSEAKLNSLI